MLNMAELEMVPAPTPEDIENTQRLERCIPVAKQVLEILFKHLGDDIIGDNAVVDKSMTPIAEEVLALFLEKDIHWTDKNFIFQLAMQPFDHLATVVTNSAELSFDKAASKKWGKDIIDLKFSDIHTALLE